jgi:hypothetical protein
VLAMACVFAAMWVAPALAQSATEIVMHNFANLPKGESPWGV